VRSVSVRLTLLFVLASAVVLTVFSVSLYLWVRDGLERSIEKDLATQAQMFHERFLEEYDEVRRGVHSDIREEMDAFLQASGGKAEVRRADGTMVYRSQGFRPAPSGDPLRTDTLKGPSGEDFIVSVATSDSSARQTLGQLRMYFAIFFPAVLLLQGILGALFVRRSLSPVEEIRQHAERISRANVSERVPVPRLTGEFRNLACTFNEMLDRLDRAMQDLESFAADAAHELRTPLANLRAEIEMAFQRRLSVEDHERILGSISEEVARMSHVVTDLFTLAKIEMRQYALQKERVRVRPLLEEARETWQPSAAERGIEIRVEGQDAEVQADPGALRRVFMNLAENAVKYNRDGGKITLAVGRENGKVRVSVRDTGLGIPEEHLPKLFRRFYRVDKARSRANGGAGLGLAICKSFVEAHEGQISVTSRPGEGTVFTVDIPAANS